MKSKTKLYSIVASLGLTLQAIAAPFAFTDGDLILGFQAENEGNSLNVFFNLGSGTSYRDNGSQGFKGNIGATLSAVYGENWYSRTDLYFGVIGNLRGLGLPFAPNPPINGDPNSTFYVSSPAATAGAGSLFAANTFVAASLQSTSTNLSGMELMLPQLVAEADNSAILDQTVQTVQWENGWTSWNPFVSPGAQGAAFNLFVGGIQQTFGKGGSATYVDVQRVLSTNTGATPAGVVGGGTYETTISISPTGAITSLSAAPASSYATWIGTFPALDTANKRLPTADPDNDGLSNLIEFVLNGNPGTSDIPSIAPTLNAGGSDFIFSFKRRDDSEAGNTLLFQYGSDLIGWTDAIIGAANSVVGSATIAVTENTTNPDAITVTVPKSGFPGGKLFGRLKVTQP